MESNKLHQSNPRVDNLKEQDQMNICDVEFAQELEHILLKNIRQKFIDCFNDMGVPWEEYRNFFVTG